MGIWWGQELDFFFPFLFLFSSPFLLILSLLTERVDLLTQVLNVLLLAVVE